MQAAVTPRGHEIPRGIVVQSRFYPTCSESVEFAIGTVAKNF